MSHRHIVRALAGAALLVASAAASASVTSPVIGKLLWSEEFNGASLDGTLWTPSNGNGCQIGLCGYGNQELETYSPNNLSIVNVPFEPATRALAITARRETVGSNAFTSGKIDSAGKVQVKYGMVEVRMATPSVGVGLWPAMWMLGTSPQTWPRNGEIDIMEQGGRQPAGVPSVSPDRFVGSNVITYQQAACVPGNESCAASTAWQTKNWATPARSLANRFVTYRLYWTDTQMRFTLVDNGREIDMYNAPLAVNSTALQAPFYLLMNMAVGGNFTNAATPGQVTAPLPATMYVDYVRVYQLDGLGEVKLGVGIQPEVGRFGVFTDTTPVDNGQALGTSADFFIWNTGSMSGGSIPPYEGSNVLALNYFAPGQWFGGAVQSRQVHDMSGFRSGNIKLKIKAPANVAFKIGILDTYTNHGWVTFPANTTAYGLVRNGEWGTATIPVAEIAGPLVALQSMNSLFEFLSVDGANPGAPFQIAFDDIVWDSGTAGPPQVTVSKPAAAIAAVTQSGDATQSGATTLSFSATASGWVDVHYSVNGGDTQYVRMRQDGRASRYTVGGLRKGDVVQYRFTSWDNDRQLANDSAARSVVMK